MDPDPQAPGHLDETVGAVRERRERLGKVLLGLEQAIAAPVGNAEAWRARVALVLDELAETLADHIVETEADDGLFGRVVRDTPRMQSSVDRLISQHRDLSTDLEDLREELRTGDAGLSVIRKAALELLTHFIRHRHGGADLLYEAYWVDVGTGD